MSHDHKLMVIDERVANLLNTPDGMSPASMMKIVAMNQDYEKIKAEKKKEEEEIDSFVYRDVMYADTKKKKGITAPSTSSPSDQSRPNPPNPSSASQTPVCDRNCAGMGYCVKCRPYSSYSCEHKWESMSLHTEHCWKCGMSRNTGY
jgi:hypothetical protein